MENATQGLLQALFHMVWADNIVSPEEVEALKTILREMGFSLAEVICILDQNLSQPPSGDAPVNLEQLFPERKDQLMVLQALMKICFSTGKIDPEQVGYIEGLVVRMGVSAHELEALRQQAMEAKC